MTATVDGAAPQRTPLYDTHLEFGARMVEFAGWSMPISFAGIIEEHQHTRSACSVFDVSHMGRLVLTGSGAGPLLNRVCTRNLSGAEPGRSFYSNICREDGGILDDVIVSRFEDSWGLVCNASNRDKIVAWLDRHRQGTDVTLRDETAATAMLAVQGPRAIDAAREVANQDFSTLKRYHFRSFEFMGLRIIVYRSGYTGEDGLEVVLPAGAVRMLLPRLLGTKDKPHAVVRPAGLGARDTLRLEAAMPLYGHELSEEVDSLTADLAWCVDLSKDFIGAEPMRQLAARGLPRRRVGLEVEGRRIARQHAAVYADGRAMGTVTSGTLSPTLDRSIAMAYVEAGVSAPGTALEVEIGSKRAAAKVVKLPFYKRPAGS
ncbi:MAG: glycine cleavage system aminomethyltransferase GcvT [Planctomycetes bacterium]|nr:glycine cleavage system aminomethyltransferase GcvT [Planctomycetota bacterium]